MAGLFFPDVFSMLGEASPETTSACLPLLVSVLFLIVPEDLPATLIAGRFGAEIVFLSSVWHAESWTWIPMPELFSKVLLCTSARDVPSMQIAACWHSSLGLCICVQRPCGVLRVRHTLYVRQCKCMRKDFLNPLEKHLSETCIPKMIIPFNGSKKTTKITRKAAPPKKKKHSLDGNKMMSF